MIIYDSSGSQILDVVVDDNSYRHRVIMGDHNITLYFALAVHVEIPIGSYCEYQGGTYSLMRPESLKEKHSRNFEYTVVMEAAEAKAKIWIFRNPVDGRLKFSLTAKPIEHLQMFVDNMNRRDTGWTVGDCISGVETLISYDHASCYSAIGQMASELKTEFEFNGKRVSLHKVEYNKTSPLSLSYGKGNGFKPNVGRSNYGDTPPVEILFVQGGSDNIDPSKYGNSELLLPKGQTISFDGTHFEDETGYDSTAARQYIVDDIGYSIRRNDKALSTLVESSVDCSDIYPKRIGKVTGVVTVDASKNFYDFIDNTIPSTLDYEDYLIAGETMTVIFQSGMLAGREFEVAYHHEVVNGKAARRFELVPQEIDGETMPNSTFIPAVNDTYAVFKCALPDAYIRDDGTKSGASWDMFREAVKSMFVAEDNQFSFSGELDGIWASKDWINIGGKILLGGYVLFSDKSFQQTGILVRITGIKDYINKPHSPVLELSNSSVKSSFSTEMKTLESREVLIDDYHRDALTFAKRRFRDAKETLTALESSLLDNFTNSVNPITVQTMAMLVGDESLQFRFVSSKTNPIVISDDITYDSNTKQITCHSSIIQHMTLGISDLSSVHSVSEYKFWDMTAYTSGRLDDGAIRYYLYAKVSKTDGTGSYLLSTTAIKIDGVDGFYHLLIGILNSEYDGGRTFTTLYGFTEILPSRITTERIVSGDGNSYFDMSDNAMKLGDAFDFNSQGDGKLRIKGTIVQNEAGTESYIGCYRGVYNETYTYYQGDEVSYTTAGNTSTYRFIHATGASGFAPTNTAYWQVIAQGATGAKGSDGTSVTIKGSVSSEIELPLSGNTVGDGYLVNGYLYVWDGTGWNNVGQIKGDKGDKGDVGNAGASAPFYELRYAVNGSTKAPPALDTSALNPSGWTTAQPECGSSEYMWLTVCQKTADGTAFVQQWSAPVRITPSDGANGSDGDSPVLVYRGVYVASKTYYGNAARLDCVKSGDTYYIARKDAGEFSAPAPPDTTKWNQFGGSFESIATNLLLAEGANIGDWFISNGKIVSTLDSGDIITLDAANNLIKIVSSKSGGGESIENIGSTIKIDASEGIIQAAANSGNVNAVSYISPTGILANRAGTNCVAATTGLDQRAAVVALGYGNMEASQWTFGEDVNLLAGVYGYALNSGTAPSFGGYFYNLKAKGLMLGTKYVTATGTYLTDAMSLVVGFTSSQAIVYLPASTREGQTILFKQWWTGYMRVYPRNGQAIYDDSSANDYIDVGEGRMMVASFVKASISGNTVQAWVIKLL